MKCRTSLCDGLPVPIIPEAGVTEREQTLIGSLPNALSSTCRIHRIQVEAVNTIRQNLELERAHVHVTINSLIEIFDNQLRTIEVGCDHDFGE